MGRTATHSASEVDEIASYSRLHGRAAARDKFKMTEGQLGGLLYRYYYKKHAPLFDVKIGGEKPVTLTGDAMIISDVHVPCTDWRVALRMCEIAEKYLPEPRTLIVAGDLVNLDWASSYPHIASPIHWKYEVKAAKALFDEWLGLFERIIVFAGNHDRRIAKWSAGNVDVREMMRGIVSEEEKRVIVSEWGHCILKSGGRTFRVTHGKNYSVNTGVVGNELANKFKQNIVSGHQHHGSISLDRTKAFIVVDNPALVDQRKLAYVTLDDNKSPNMGRGFTMIRNGEPTLFLEGLTQWANWLPEATAKRKAA